MTGKARQTTAGTRGHAATLGRVDALDGLRCLAIVGVVLYHANSSWLPGGYLGVSVFLVLTGYLTTLSIMRRLARTGRLGHLAYLAARVRRLVPAMLAVAGVTALLCLVAAPALLHKAKDDVVPALLFFENIYYLVRNVPYFAAAGLPSPFTHFWYLGVLMQLSVVWPLVLFVLTKVVRSRRAAAVVCACLALASALEMALLYDPLADTARVYYGPDTRAAEFLVGAALALWTNGRGLTLRLPSQQRGARELSWAAHELVAAGALVGLAAMAITLNGYSEFVYRGGFLLASVLAALIIGVATRPEGSLVGTVLSLRPLAVVGTRSFSVYLWHYPLLLVMNPANRTSELPWWGWALELALIAVVSEASWRLFEAQRSVPAGGTGSLREPQAIKRALAGLPVPRKAALLLDALGVLAALVLAIAPLSPASGTSVPSEQQAEEQEASQESPEQGEDGDSEGAQNAEDETGEQGEGQQPTVDPETGACDARVLLIGDSVPGDALNEFAERFPEGRIDAVIGRQLYAGTAAYDACVADGYDPDYVVWSIGDNGIARDYQVRELIEHVDADKHVYLVTVRTPEALQDLNNQLFHEIAAEYDNVEIIDWYAASAGHDEYFWDDGTHLRPEGAVAYMNLLRDSIAGQ